LKRLALNLARVPSDIITTVFSNAPALFNVYLTFTSVDVVDAPVTTRQVTLSALRFLELLSAAVQVLSQPNITWQFPSLIHMTIDIMQIDTAHWILDTVHATLVGLTLYGPGVIGEPISFPGLDLMLRISICPDVNVPDNSTDLIARNGQKVM